MGQPAGVLALMHISIGATAGRLPTISTVESFNLLFQYSGRMGRLANCSAAHVYIRHATRYLGCTRPPALVPATLHMRIVDGLYKL